MHYNFPRTFLSDSHDNMSHTVELSVAPIVATSDHHVILGP